MAERELRSAAGVRGRVGEGRAPEARGPGARRGAALGAPSGWASGDDSGLIDLKALRSLNALRSAGEAEPEGPMVIPVPHLQLFPFGAPEEPQPPCAAPPPPPAALPEAPPPAPRRLSRVGSALQMLLGAALALAAVGVGYAAASLRAEAPAPSAATASLAAE